VVESSDEMQDHVLIYLNGQRLEVVGDDVFASLVDFLRQRRGLLGTRVACGEGDCGACTVLVGRPFDGILRYRTAAACLQAMYQLDSTHVVTIEGLTPAEGLSQIQQAIVEHHGSQCGYCTPGVVAALEGVFEAETSVDLSVLRTGLTGNLCRCTGYLSILEAGLAVDRTRLAPLGSRYPSCTMAQELTARARAPIRIEHGERVFYSPVKLVEAVRFLSRHPGSLIVSGGTETGLARNKRGSEPNVLLSLSNIGELGQITYERGVLSIGASVTWTDIEEFSRGKLPVVHALTGRFGSPQIRNSGTLVGNIAHGSPVADSLCFLLISGAELEVTGPVRSRRVMVEDFYRGPKQTSLTADELITRVNIPLPGSDELVKLYKISKRKEIDTSTFRAGIRVAQRQGLIERALIACSGVGPTAIRLKRTESFLVGKHFSESTFREAGKQARAEVEPISDVRGSRQFRLQLTENILLKFWLESTGALRREATLGG
jgi:xanthine dehydrogenase small subunit